MTNHDYNYIERRAYDEAFAFFMDAETATLEEGYNIIQPMVFSEMLEAYDEYGAADISDVVYAGIDLAWGQVLSYERNVREDFL